MHPSTTEIHIPNNYLVNPPEINNTIGEYLCNSGVRQFAISETQKYGHVTYFFNGNRSGKFSEKLETYQEIPSDIIPFEQRPWMQCAEITDAVIAAIESGKYDFIRLNYPNGDMVGHTGVFDAAVKAVEAVDKCVGEVTDAVLNAGGVVFLTADHGNAEKMKNPDGSPFTAHTTNVVPFAVIGAGDVKLREGGCLADIAPTMLPYIGLPVPAEMTGKSIIVE